MVVRPWLQDFLSNLKEVSVSPYIQTVQISLDGKIALWRISQSAHFCVMCKLAEDTLHHIIQIINEDVKQDRIQYWHLVYSASYWLPARCPAIEYQLLGTSIQPVFSPAQSDHPDFSVPVPRLQLPV